MPVAGIGSRIVALPATVTTPSQQPAQHRERRSRSLLSVHVIVAGLDAATFDGVAMALCDSTIASTTSLSPTPSAAIAVSMFAPEPVHDVIHGEPVSCVVGTEARLRVQQPLAGLRRRLVQVQPAGAAQKVRAVIEPGGVQDRTVVMPPGSISSEVEPGRDLVDGRPEARVRQVRVEGLLARVVPPHAADGAVAVRRDVDTPSCAISTTNWQRPLSCVKSNRIGLLQLAGGIV
jgi:hypothetical protein